METPKEFKLHNMDYSTFYAPAASVETFMQVAGHLPWTSVAPRHERKFDLDTVRLYYKFIQEEFEELQKAFDAYDKAITDTDVMDAREALVEILDGGHDLIWVTLGMLLATGHPIQAGWLEVANSNMAKINKATLQLDRREDGKILKPKGWKPPDFMKLVRAHLDKKIIV